MLFIVNDRIRNLGCKCQVLRLEK